MMMEFEYYNPTRILFGSEHYQKLPQLIAPHLKSGKILLTYGGGSIFKNGIHAQVIQRLTDFEVIEFGGIEANPEYDTLMKAVELAREEQVDFVLAVGGGSVIDGTKFIVAAIHHVGNPWEILERTADIHGEKCVPFGTVLTLPATGSEANSGAVISNTRLKAKRTMGHPNLFPQFSVCDPKAVATLPKRQIANGITDAFVHVLEQYLTYPSDNLLQERQAEAVLQTLLEIAPNVLANPGDAKAAANLMWCATHALNGLLRCGVPTDWSTHMIGHELTARYGIDHARTLAIIGPRLIAKLKDSKHDKLVQYGMRVWGLKGEPEKIAEEAIAKTETFYQSLGIETKLSAYTDDTAHIAREIKQTFHDRNWLRLGELQKVTPDLVAEIVAESI